MNVPLLRRLATAGLILTAGSALVLPAGVAQGQGGANASIQVDGSQRLSYEDMLKYASETLKELNDHQGRIEKAVEEAKKQRDVLLLNCLTEKLTDLRYLQRVAETAKAKLEEAVARAERDRADHEFSKVVIARTRGRELAAEASACSGEGILTQAEGPTIVIDSGPGDEDPIEDPDVTDIDQIPTSFPPSASPIN